MHRLARLSSHLRPPAGALARGLCAGGTPAPVPARDERPPVALVVGAGAATGSAIARRFAREGMTVVATRRNGAELERLVAEVEGAGGRIHAFGTDARKEEAVVSLVQQIEDDIGPIEVAVHNIGANVFFPIGKTTLRVFRKVHEMCAVSAFLVGREVSERMRARGRGSILYSGATASVRGSAGFAAFASAKHAVRALAQSMARELGPQGVHVAHVVLDGMVDTPWIRENFESMVAQKPADGIMRPDDIAEVFWQLHQQPRSTWTHEMDLRPWAETF